MPGEPILRIFFVALQRTINIMAQPNNRISLVEENQGPDEGRLARMFRKIKEDPAVPIGMGPVQVISIIAIRFQCYFF